MAELKFICAKCIGLNDLRARINVTAVNFSDYTRLRQVQGIEALVEGDAARVQLRTRRPIR
jgi:hypothetical protein